MEQKRVGGGKSERVQRVRQVSSKPTQAPPKRIKVGYLDIRVDSSPQAVLRSYINDSEVVFGRYDERQGVITLSTDAHPAVVRETLVHEILHAIIKQFAPPMEDDEEERMVRYLSAPLYATISQNKELVKFLMS